MPAITNPGFDFDYNLDEEIRALRYHQRQRGIPEKKPTNLLIASWNLCNLGDPAQPRTISDLALMAEIMLPFDLIAVQEIKDDFQQFREVVYLMGERFDFMITDRAGNDERLGFIYDKTRVSRLQLAGELVIQKRERKNLKVNYKGKVEKAEFTGFDRNPYLAAFSSNQFIFTLVNVHILSGRGKKGYLRRVAEVYNLAFWAHKRVTAKRAKTFDHDIILIGDFNIPQASTTDTVGKQLLKFGMELTTYGSSTGTNLKANAHYDQIAFHPGHTVNKYTNVGGVFDFDKALFKYVWNNYTSKEFVNFIKYHISDHRLLWSEWNNTFS